MSSESSAASSSGREVSGEGPMISRPDSPAAQGRPDRAFRLIAFGALLVGLSPGVLLGWGFSLGMLAGCAISYGLWWVNHD